MNFRVLLFSLFFLFPGILRAGSLEDFKLHLDAVVTAYPEISPSLKTRSFNRTKSLLYYLKQGSYLDQSNRVIVAHRYGMIIPPERDAGSPSGWKLGTEAWIVILESEDSTTQLGFYKKLDSNGKTIEVDFSTPENPPSQTDLNWAMKLSRLGSLWLPLTLRESGGTGDSVQAPSSFKRRQLDEATEPSLAPDDQIAALQERCLQLESQNAQLQSEIVERDAKIARLEACIAASSQTSSQPRESVNPSLNSTGGRKLKANVTESERSLMDWLESTEFKSRDR